MTGLEMKYFVLKPKGNSPYAKASRIALKAYADAINDENPKLTHDLHMWAIEEQAAVNREIIKKQFESENDKQK